MIKGIKRILVTGSSGMIGTRLSEVLIKEGYIIVGADKRKNVWNKKIDDLTIKIDLLDKKLVLDILPKEVDCIIHLAANARVFDLVKNPSLARDNFEMIFNMLEFARINSIPRFIFSSSREVYGNSRKIKHKEIDALVDSCESPYSATKIGGEAMVQSYHRCYNLDFLIFRLSNVYGMYDDSNRLIPLFIKECFEKKNLKVYGDNKILDFTHVDDVAGGMILAINNFDKAKNGVYNLGSGRGVSVLQVAAMIQKCMSSLSEVSILQSRIGEVVKYVALIKKAKKHFGFVPQVDLFTGIYTTIEWYKNFMKSKQDIIKAVISAV